MNVRFRILLSVFLIGGMGCAHIDKGHRNDGYTPAQIACPVPTDPTCVGEATAGIQIPIRERATASNPLADDHTIVGRCEMYVGDEQTPRPCNQLKLVARSTRNNEARAIVVDGFTFRAANLAGDSYRIESVSPDFEVISDAKPLSPGQNVKIRVKPRL